MDADERREYVMECERIKDHTTGELIAIVCRSRGRKHRCACGAVAGLQCDWKTAKGKTCDAWICASCAQEVAPNKHLCPEHQRTYKEWLARRAAPSLNPQSSILNPQS
jgi:hypothetical protein